MTTMGPAEAAASARELRKLIGSPKQERHFLLGFRSRSTVLRVQKRPFKAAQVAHLRREEGYSLAVRGSVVWTAEGVLRFRSPQASRARPRWAAFKKALAREFPAFKRCQLSDAVLEKGASEPTEEAGDLLLLGDAGTLPSDLPLGGVARLTDGVLTIQPDASEEDIEALLDTLLDYGVHTSPLDAAPDAGLSGGLAGLDVAPSGLRFDRGAESLPGSEPALTFQEALQVLSDPALDDTAFRWLNELLAAAWASERAEGKIPEETTFQSYKLQFLQLDTPDHGPVSAQDWGLLHIKASDLPDTPQQIVPATIAWRDPSGTPQQLTRRLTLPADRVGAGAAREALAAEGWPADGLDITLHEPVGVLPGAEDVLTALDAIPASALRALLSDPSGQLDGSDGSPLDLSAPEVVLDLQDTAAPLIRNLALGATFRQWSESSGAAVTGLLAAVPAPAQLFLQPTPKPERPGKCAPLSATSAALCGIGGAARGGLVALRSEPATQALAEELEALLQHAPMDADTRAAVSDALQQLRSAAPPALRPSVDAVETLFTAVLSRLEPSQDEHGPFFEMTFTIPRTPAARGLTPGAHTVRLRAEDLQAFNEELRSPDAYPGARQPLESFLTDPHTLSGLASQGAVGAGLISAGLDKALRASGSAHGLIYGTAPEVVASMLHGNEQRTFHIDLDAGPARTLRLLQYGQSRGAGISARLGHDEATGRSAPVLTWGRPHLSGAPVEAAVLADCTAADPTRVRRGLAACPPLRALLAVDDEDLSDAVAAALRAGLDLEPTAGEEAVVLLDDRGALRACTLAGDPALPLSGLTVTVRR